MLLLLVRILSLESNRKTRLSCVHIDKNNASQKPHTHTKPPVPSIRDAPKLGTRTEKNFIQTNALDVILTVPKKPERNIVDDRHGDKFPVDPSGLKPRYIFKKVLTT